MFDEYKKVLEFQKISHLYRNPPVVRTRQGKYVDIGSTRLINFSSNDYLGLSSDKRIKDIFFKNFNSYPVSSSSSRLVCGNYSVVLEAERKFADFFGYEECLFFQTGFQANLALMSTIFFKDHGVIVDKHVHASTVLGLKLGKINFKTYKHNDINHLEKRINKSGDRRNWVVTESVFSMDGDVLDIEKFFEVKKRYGFNSVVDEAHSVGAMGKEGKGITTSASDIVVGTFNKAFAFFGAFLLMPSTLKEYMFNFAAPLIYSTTLPPAHGACAMDILDLVRSLEDRRWCLKEIASYAKERLQNFSIPFSGNSYILSIHIGKESIAKEIARQLMDRGYMVFYSRYPTVPVGQAMLRLSFCYFHTEKDINTFIEHLKDVLFNNGILK